MKTTKDTITVKERKPYTIKESIAAIALCAQADIKLHQDRLLVLPAEAEEITKHGLIIPDTAKEKPKVGCVVRIGAGLSDGKMLVKEVGEVVVFGKYTGTEVNLAGTDLLQLRDSDLFWTMGEHMVEFIDTKEQTEEEHVKMFSIIQGGHSHEFAKGVSGEQLYRHFNVDPLKQTIVLTPMTAVDMTATNIVANDEPLIFPLGIEFIMRIDNEVKEPVKLVAMVCFMINDKEQPHVANTTGETIYKVLAIDPEKDKLYLVRMGEGNTDLLVQNTDEPLDLWRGVQKSGIECYTFPVKVGVGG